MRRKSQLGRLVLALTLFLGALGGMPMTPEEIEDPLRLHSQTKVISVLETDAAQKSPSSQDLETSPLTRSLR